MSDKPDALKQIPDGLVVLTFDDGCKSDIENVAPLLKKRGFGATFFVSEAQKPYGGWPQEHYLTWDDVAELHNAGFEIGNHTASHPDVTRLSEAEFVRELERIEQGCRKHGIPAPRTFCYPGFSYSQAAVDILARKGYLFARRGTRPEIESPGEGGRGPAYNPVIHHPLLIPTTGFSGPRWGFEDLVWAVEQARGGKIAVLCFHGVPDLDHPWVQTDPAAFAKYMAYLDETDCTVIAMRDLAQYIDTSAAPSDNPPLK